MNLFDRLLNFHQKHRWLSHVIFWLIYLLIAVSSSKYRDGDRGSYGFEFMSDALYMSAEMILAYALAYFVVPQFINHKRYLVAAAGFILANYAACVTGRIFIVKICEPLAGIPPKAFETYQEIFTDIPKLLFNYDVDMMTTSALFVFFKLLKDQLIVQKRALQMEKEKAETELKLLKTQLNPHFLFNTLNNIYSLSLSSSPATSGSIARLADILDHILYRCNEQYVPLKAEISLIKNYIELEKLRYDKRLTVNFNADVEKEIDIAPLILLSLVENAFKHGASDDTGAPVIGIDLKANEKSFIFIVSNTVTSQNNVSKTPGAERIGLNNLRRQLDLVYGEDYKLEVTRGDQHFTVQLAIQFKKEAAKHEKDPVLIG
ncbi:MAG TPA: histidine kinase [Mucilaginibacter sp.]|nr:histidine kinase [Mucilaginibacter sp.]